MVEIFLPACPVSPSLGVRLNTRADARALFFAFANDCDEVVMAVLGPFEDLFAMVVFGGVALAEIHRDPGPLVTLARNLGAESVVISHFVEGMIVDGTAEIDAQRVVGLALEVDDIHLVGWHTLSSASIANNVGRGISDLLEPRGGDLENGER